MYGGWLTSSDACWASLLCRCCCGSPWSSGWSRHSSHIPEPRPQETSTRNGISLKSISFLCNFAYHSLL